MTTFSKNSYIIYFSMFQVLYFTHVQETIAFGILNFHVYTFSVLNFIVPKCLIHILLLKPTFFMRYILLNIILWHILVNSMSKGKHIGLWLLHINLSLLKSLYRAYSALPGLAKPSTHKSFF